ncbi:hypothetical protein ACFOUV_07330 [Oceanobacillus longus]|uniref:P/Homo B domain-containing protein n=1 Tax=Oceanobacillus longus TaxID=930120 RepID=A0ABV8GVM6_9BACI
MVLRENFIQSVANMEDALTNALNAASGNATPSELERLLKLIIKKEIVLEFLLDEFPDLCRVTTSTFSNTTPILIPAEGSEFDEGPAAPYPSSVNVSGLTGAVQKVTVTFNNLSHTYPADISALLVAPDGQDTILMSTAGGGNDINNVTLTFDDDAPTLLPEFDQITSGTYQPTNYGVFDTYPPPAPTPSGNTELSIYDNTAPNGTWNLYIIDQFQADVGVMAGGWELSITSCEPLGSVPNGVPQSNVENAAHQVEQVESKPLTEEEQSQKQEKIDYIKKLKSEQ